MHFSNVEAGSDVDQTQAPITPSYLWQIQNKGSSTLEISLFSSSLTTDVIIQLLPDSTNGNTTK